MLGPTKSRTLGRSVPVCLESLVPADHFYRRLEARLDLSFVRDRVKHCYFERGRPSVDPVVFFKLQLVLYLEGLRSERQLMRLAAELEEQNGLRHDWIAEEGRPERDVQRGTYRRVSDFIMSTTDPDAALMRAKVGGPLRLGYQDTYVTDGGRARIIMSVLVTPGEVMENQVMLDLLWHTCFRWKLWPDQVAADTTYGTIENIIPIEDAGISMYTPVPDWEKRTNYFGAFRFTYDLESDTYCCPNGQTLRRETAKYTEDKIVYHADSGPCDSCPLKAQCTSSKEGRRLHRSIDEDYLDRVRAHHETEAYEKAMRKRKLWTEPLFAEAKLWHGLRRFRLRRLWRVNIEALMIAAAQNLKRLLAWHRKGCRPASGMVTPVPLMGEDRSLAARIIAWIRVIALRSRSRRLIRWVLPTFSSVQHRLYHHSPTAT